MEKQKNKQIKWRVVIMMIMMVVVTLFLGMTTLADGSTPEGTSTTTAEAVANPRNTRGAPAHDYTVDVASPSGTATEYTLTGNIIELTQANKIYQLTGTTTTYTVTLTADNITLILDDCNLKITDSHSAINLNGYTATVFLADESDNSISYVNNGYSHGAGIGVNSTANLTVKGGGKLTINANNGAAIGGAGGYTGEACGMVTIESGSLVLNSFAGAGIGGGLSISATVKGGGGGTVRITGGNIIITTRTAAAIGGGAGGGDGGQVFISGGFVHAKSSGYGAGIGGAGSISSMASGDGGTVAITGGTVIAEGANAAGIGGGMHNSNGVNGAAGTGTITGGSVTIKSGAGASEMPFTSNGTLIYSNVLELENLSTGKQVTFLEVNNISLSVTGMSTTEENGKTFLSLWLPDSSSAESIVVTIDGLDYSASYARSSSNRSAILRSTTAPAPTAIPTGGEVAKDTGVTLSCSEIGATIYYTIDGSAPTTSSTVYSAPITVGSAMTIQAIAVKTGMHNSAVMSVSYTVKTVPIPTASPTGGEVAKDTGVTLSCSEIGATIYYTTDGSAPTTSSTVYSAPITVGSAMTIQAIAVKTGMHNSAVMSVIYTVKTVPTPTASPTGGEVAKDTGVTLSCSEIGATIYYTTDGSAPTTSSTVYSAPITVGSAMTIQAIAVKTGMHNSAVMSVIYTVKTEPIIPPTPPIIPPTPPIEPPILPSIQPAPPIEPPIPPTGRKVYASRQIPSVENNYTMIVDVDFKEFEGVEIDRKALTKSDHTAWSGSTFVRLNPSFLANLSAGNHTIVLNFKNGTVTATFTKAATNAGVTTTDRLSGGVSRTGDFNPNTGGGMVMSVTFAFAILSMGAAVYSIRKRLQRILV